jgi:adenylate cyclase class IV
MQNDKRVEVEFRGLLSKNDYNRVIEKLRKEGKLIKKFKRLLLAYSTFKEGNTSDIRCRITDDEPELIAKVGEQSSSKREEIEVKLAKGNFVEAVKFMNALGYSKAMLFLRVSERYIFRGVEITIVKPIILKNNLKRFTASITKLRSFQMKKV